MLLAFGRKLKEPLAGWVGDPHAAAGAFVATVVVFLGLHSTAPATTGAFVQILFEWLPVGGLHVDAGFLVDPLSVTMALFVTGIGTLIHLYSIGYMHGDRDFSKFFVYLNLFVFSMLCLVLSNNFLLTFLGWEGVGTCSYLLDLVLVHRRGQRLGRQEGLRHQPDRRLRGFMLAMFLLFGAVGLAASYGEVLDAASTIAPVTATAIVLLLFLGRRAASRPRSRCSCGCPTPWPARRRCRRSSTPPPWSPRASTSWSGSARSCTSPTTGPRR